MYELPKLKFAQLAPEEQRMVRTILEEQPVTKTLEPELRNTFVEQMISYIDNGHAKIEYDGHAFRVVIHLTTLAAIEAELGIDAPLLRLVPHADP